MLVVKVLARMPCCAGVQVPCVVQEKKAAEIPPISPRVT